MQLSPNLHLYFIIILLFIKFNLEYINLYTKKKKKKKKKKKDYATTKKNKKKNNNRIYFIFVIINIINY